MAGKKKNTEIELETQVAIDLNKLYGRTPKEVLKTRDDVSSYIVSPDSGPEKPVLIKEEGAIVPIKSRISLTYEGLEGVDIEGKYKFGIFDKEVLDAVISLYKEGNKAVTTAMVYRVMTGKQNREFVHENKLEEISKSLDKCRFMNLRIDLEDGSTQNTSLITEISGNLLHADKARAKINGARVEAYRIMGVPMLYQYAQSQNKISEIPLKVLSTPPSKTKETISLQGYLISCIEKAKSTNQKTLEISYENIYTAAEVEDDRKIKTRCRNKIREIVEYWRDEVKYIKGYYDIKNRNKIVAIYILL